MPLHLIDKDRNINYYIKKGIQFDAEICDAMYASIDGRDYRLIPFIASDRRGINISDMRELSDYMHKLNGLNIGDVFRFVGDKSKMNYIFVVLSDEKAERTPELLLSCYLNALKYAVKLNYKSILMPVFFVGSIAYRTSEVYNIAVAAINEILSENKEINIYLDMKSDRRPAEALKYINKKCKARLNPDWESEYSAAMKDANSSREMLRLVMETASYNEPKVVVETKTEYVKVAPKFEKEKLCEFIFDYFDKTGMNQTKLAGKAGINTGTLSKLLNHNNKSNPEKNTVVSLAVAMELNPKERTEFIMLGGYFYPDDDRDEKIEEYISKGKIKVPEINDMLFNDGYDILTKDSYNTKVKSRSKNKTKCEKKPDISIKSRF